MYRRRRRLCLKIDIVDARNAAKEKKRKEEKQDHLKTRERHKEREREEA